MEISYEMHSDTSIRITKSELDFILFFSSIFYFYFNLFSSFELRVRV